MAKAGKGNFRQAMKALGTAKVPTKEFGKLNSDGSISINPKTLEVLKKRLGRSSKKVRFVALNAPFKRRSPTTPA